MPQTVRKVAMVILAGPIKHWWDDNWDTPEHWHYDAWREALNKGLVADGHYLVYRPHHAYKGTWTERGQVVNDAALAACDLVIDMTPPGVPSEGTVSEIKQASSSGALIVQAPPPGREEDFVTAIAALIEELEALGVHRDMVDQEEVIECISWLPGREWLFQALHKRYLGHPTRIHHLSENNELVVEDAWDYFATDDSWVITRSPLDVWVPFERVLKIEVLQRG
jgi:hypothetical protein